MSLAPGSRLGGYDIRGALGAGGMGEVYRAHDPKLRRDVAIKIVTDSFDSERAARFQREAQLLAALNHPNIATIYGLEQTNGAQFLVMELVEGDTLAQRLKSGALAVAEALAIARQIADALQAAHEKGIIHRDLKPANIALTPEGQVKVLDFGLAKALGPGELGSAIDSPALLTHSPTLSLAATQAGVILGTAAYMAPEQAKGKPADKRSDIWSFGCVLYEMLTGTRAFEGEDASETLAFVMAREPDWTPLPEEVPPPIRVLLRRCLERDRRKRIADVAVALFALDEGPSLAPRPAPVAVQDGRTVRTRFVVAAASAAAIAALLSVAVWRTPTSQPPAPQAVRFQVGPPPNSTLVTPLSGADNSGTVSPDGTRLAFVAADQSGTGVLWVRPLDSLDARPLAGTEGAAFPFWSPDGQFIGYFTSSALKKVPADGGPSQTISSRAIAGAGGATWGSQGTILFANSAGPILRVSAEGGQPVPLIEPDAARGEFGRFWPEFLPDGRRFVFWAQAVTPDSGGIFLGSIDSREVTRLAASDTKALFAVPDSLLFVRQGTLLQQRFDVSRLELTDPRLHSRSSASVGVGVSGRRRDRPGRRGRALEVRVRSWIL